MFVQGHPTRSSYHYNHNHNNHHHNQQPQPQRRSNHQARIPTSGQQLHSHLKKYPSSTPTLATHRPVSGPNLHSPTEPNKPPNKLNSNFKVRDKSYTWLKACISLNRIKVKRFESLPCLAISFLSFEESKKRSSCDCVLLDILKRRIQLTDDNCFRKTKSSFSDCTQLEVRHKVDSLTGEPDNQNCSSFSSSLKNIWNFSYFWVDFLTYQVETWRLIAETTLFISKHTYLQQPVKLDEPKCIKTASSNEPDSVTSCNREMSPLTIEPAVNPMSFNDYYSTPGDQYVAAGYLNSKDKTALDTRPRVRTRMGARNPLYRNLSLNVETAGAHSYYATDYYQQPQRPHSSRADYPTGATTKRASTNPVAFDYQQRFYHQHFSADCISYNNKAYLTDQLYASQSIRPSSMGVHSSSNQLPVSAGYGAIGCGQLSGAATLMEPSAAYKAAKLPLTTIHSSEHQSTALSSSNYGTGGHETLRSLPITKVELSSRQPAPLTDTNHHFRHHRNNPTYLSQMQQPTFRRHYERPSSSMSHQKSHSEATESRNVVRHSVEVVGGPAVGSDTDLATDWAQNGRSNQLNQKGQYFYHIHTTTHNKRHEKVSQTHSSGSNPTTSSKSPAELTRIKSQNSGSRKQNSSSLKLSLTGARKRLGFKQSGSTALIVQRSEEILPSEASSFLNHQPNNYWASSSSETNHSFFIEGLGPGQIVSRQGLVSPYLGDIQLTLTDRRGMLEVEVVRARRLQLKAGAESFPAPYVKIYLMKDKKCIAKWKTSTIVRTLDPLYQELFIFREDYADCILQVIVWGYYGKKDKKSLMGVAQIHLNDVDISNLVIGWYKLFNAPSMTNSLHSSKNLRKMLTKNLTIAN